MKRIVVFLLLFVPFLSPAQEKLVLKPFVGYSYNQSFTNQGSVAAVTDYKIVPNCTLRAGFYANTANFYSVTFGTKLDLNNSFYLTNRYLYRAFARNNNQEFAIGLILGYKKEHWDFQLGYNSRFFTQIKSEVYSYIVEPANILYSVEYKVFTKEHNWNVGARISNMDDFIMERQGSPIYSILADYRVNGSLNLFATLSSIPSGVCNTAVSYLDYSLKFGLEILW